MIYRERSEEKRRVFIEKTNKLSKDCIVYVDESGMDQFLYREHARALRGQKVSGIISGRKYKRISIVAAQCDGKVLAPLEYSGTTDSVLFEYWFEHLLLPELSVGHVIVMDNAAFHRKEVLRRLAGEFGCSLMFLPAYSPDLNPIEHFWAWIKRKLKDFLPAADSFDSALSDLFQLV